MCLEHGAHLRAFWADQRWGEAGEHERDLISAMESQPLTYIGIRLEKHPLDNRAEEVQIWTLDILHDTVSEMKESKFSRAPRTHLGEPVAGMSGALRSFGKVTPLPRVQAQDRQQKVALPSGEGEPKKFYHFL